VSHLSLSLEDDRERFHLRPMDPWIHLSTNPRIHGSYRTREWRAHLRHSAHEDRLGPRLPFGRELALPAAAALVGTVSRLLLRRRLGALLLSPWSSLMVDSAVSVVYGWG
jgi:hypothetical protein